MLQRITSGWTITRSLYAILGLMVLAQAIAEKQWAAVPFGAYFAAMGILNFGCAANACTVPSPAIRSTKHSTRKEEQIEFEEITQS